ncbi:MAG TPA: hypothetical protein VFZ32_14355 [Micromonosporaceae bacterium]
MTKAIYAAPLPPPLPQRAGLHRHEALRRLVSEGVLSTRQADAVQEALHLESGQPASPGTAAAGPAAPTAPATPSAARRIPWAEISGYLGGALVLTGAILLVATSWEDLTALARTALVAVFAVLLLVAGTVAAGGVSGLATARQRAQNARLRVAGALLALGACATAFAVGVALPADTQSRGVAIASGVGLLVAVAGYTLLPTVFGLIGSVLLGLYTVTSAVDAAMVASSLNIGLAWFGFGLLITVMAIGGVLRQPQLGLGLGIAVAMVGAQLPLGHHGAAPWAYLLTTALALGCLALYRFVRTPVLLVAGVVGVTLAVPEAIWDLTDGTVGAAAILLVAGTVLLAVSGLGFRLHRRGHPEPAS